MHGDDRIDSNRIVRVDWRPIWRGKKVVVMCFQSIMSAFLWRRRVWQDIQIRKTTPITTINSAMAVGFTHLLGWFVRWDCTPFCTSELPPMLWRFVRTEITNITNRHHSYFNTIQGDKNYEHENINQTRQLLLSYSPRINHHALNTISLKTFLFLAWNVHGEQETTYKVFRSRGQNAVCFLHIARCMRIGYWWVILIRFKFGG